MIGLAPSGGGGGGAGGGGGGWVGRLGLVVNESIGLLRVTIGGEGYYIRCSYGEVVGTETLFWIS